MAIDAKNNALSVDQVKTITQVIEPDILESAALVNDTVFEDLKINVIRNLENVNSLIVFDRKVGTSRRYQAGKPLNSKLGFMHERELKVALSWNQWPENIQNFREKVPFSVLGTNEENSFSTSVTAFLLRNMALEYSQDVASNLFFGKESLDENDPYGMYDGYFTHIAKDINAGRISEAKKNYQTLDPIDGTSPTDDYATFVKFYQGLDTRLKANPEVLIYCSETTRTRIVHGYLQTYQGMQSVNAMDPNFKFLDTPKARLVAHSVLGDGDCLIATVPYNLDFGSDMTGSVFNSFIKVLEDPTDANVWRFQIQSAQGTRIRSINPDKFCVSSGKNSPSEIFGGEYTKNTLTVGVNDTTMGSVSYTPEQEEYNEGDKVTMTATAQTGYKFVKWSDNATINPRTIVFGGFPETYEAIFEKGAEEEAGE